MRLRPPARALVLAGFMGTGKSAVGQLLAARLGLRLVETDALIEEAAGRTIPDLFAQEGEAAFRDLEATAVRSAAALPGVVVSTGGGALLRAENVAALREAGPLFCLRASADTLLARTAGDDYRPLLQVADPRAEVTRLLADREPAYAQADYSLDTDLLSPDQVAEAVLDLLAQDPRGATLAGRPLRLPVPVPGAAYALHVGRGLLACLGDVVPPPRPGARAALLTSDRLAPLFGQPAVAALQAGAWEVTLHTVPDGEATKRMAVAEALCEELAAAGHDRASWVFAVGGGVMGDLGGFVASVFMRGLPFVTVPTSLLAQVDASVGGKVAVNLHAGKNLVGSFHQPRAVVVDVGVLASLPGPQWAEGFAEIIKHAALADAELFAWLEEHAASLRQERPGAWEYLVGRNCQIKAEVVAADPLEHGWRAVLNFGHTVGHALERGAGDWALAHGAAVALGMLAETRWAEARGWTPAGTAERLRALLAALQLPATCPREVDRALAVRALRADKKLRGGALALPVLNDIGSVRLVEGLGLTDLEPALDLALEG